MEINSQIEKFKKILNLSDPLFRNSILLMLTSISSAGFGFLFWIIAAKLYSQENVGVATALISTMNLIILITRFGLDFSIVRFLPLKGKNAVINTSIIISTVAAIFFGIIFIFLIDMFASELTILKSRYAILYIFTLIVSSIIFMTGNSFNAMRKTEYNLLQTMILGLRIIFLFPLIKMGAFGIFLAVTLSFFSASIFSIRSLMKMGLNLKFNLDSNFLFESFNFSIGNYIVGFFTAAPNYIIPIYTLNILGAESAAYYYLAFSIASIIFMMPNAMSMSLLIEGSHGEALKKSVFKSIKIIYTILIPSILIIYTYGGNILELLGKDYSEMGLELLRTMIVSSLFMVIVYIYYSIKRVQKDTKKIVILSGIIFIGIIFFGYVFMLKYGLIGIGYSWLITYVIGALIAGIDIYKIIFAQR